VVVITRKHRVTDKQNRW